MISLPAARAAIMKIVNLCAPGAIQSDAK